MQSFSGLHSPGRSCLIKFWYDPWVPIIQFANYTKTKRLNTRYKVWRSSVIIKMVVRKKWACKKRNKKRKEILYIMNCNRRNKNARKKQIMVNWNVSTCQDLNSKLSRFCPKSGQDIVIYHLFLFLKIFKWSTTRNSATYVKKVIRCIQQEVSPLKSI